MKKQINSNRGEKIASKVQILAAEILRDNYPDISITLTGSESHGGLQFVRLFWQGDKALQARLNGITGQVRFELAARMNQKYVPDLQFAYDDTLEKAQKIEELLKNI
ncbi:MAG: ribosome-binding factor A [Rickettsiales bacterium]|jgi:ribosome-binding factor A|nr:ribosome-binding factor A [Rickettsiales bacterium]